MNASGYKHVQGFNTCEAVPGNGKWLYSENDADGVEWHYCEIPGTFDESEYGQSQN